MVGDALSSELGLDNPYTIATEMAGTNPGNGYIVEAIAQYLRQIQSGNK